MKTLITLTVAFTSLSAHAQSLGNIFVSPTTDGKASLLYSTTEWSQVGGRASSDYRVAQPKAELAKNCEAAVSAVTERLKAIAPQSVARFSSKIILMNEVEGSGYPSSMQPENQTYDMQAFYGCAMSLEDPNQELRIDFQPKTKEDNLVPNAQELYRDPKTVAVGVQYPKWIFKRAFLIKVSLAK